jgi:phosphoribosylformylglycinamidine synthase subunit PurS
MRAKVFVSLKKSVLDPQGKTIHNSLRNLGYSNVEEVRQGKFFDILLDTNLSPAEARQEVEKMAKSVLTNSVIEEYTYQID